MTKTMLYRFVLFAILGSIPSISSAGTVTGLIIGSALANNDNSEKPTVVESQSNSLECDNPTENECDFWADVDGSNIRVRLSFQEYVSYKARIPLNDVEITKLVRVFNRGYLRTVVIEYKAKEQKAN